MKQKLLCIAVVFGISTIFQSFCGFYVATGDQRIYNEASEVILVRNNNKTTITMKNDFQGDVKDFAMVVPVPVVLKEKDIKTVNPKVFEKLNKYSEPRLVEYHDDNPCYEYAYELDQLVTASYSKAEAPREKNKKDYKVTVEAQYKVGEYDILILSAKESGGLKEWLTDHKYSIPENAEEVLDPYIKDKLKFFVVKVDVKEMHRLGRKELSPIQISFESEKFMLPIRLGMANAKSYQDLLIYAFTENGRVEATNYRTKKIPTDKNIPTFMRPKFQEFYRDMFNKQYEIGGKKSIFLEYAWDLNSDNYQKCDPCSTTPPAYADLKDAGVDFVKFSTPQGWQGSDYEGELFFTRLHVRYERENFPQDLQFQVTPNTENFQGRYIMQHSADVNLDECDKARSYLNGVLDRREDELETLAYLTGWDVSQYGDYPEEIAKDLGFASYEYQPKDKLNQVAVAGVNINKNIGILVFVLGLLGISFWAVRKRKTA